MEFDKSRVYTALNADEVKPGSRVIVADDLDALRKKVEKDTEQYPFDEVNLDKVNRDSNPYRFAIAGISYMLCYLVKEPRRMTNRELAKWLAQGNGQWKGTTTIHAVDTSYSYTFDDKEVPDGIMIRGWDEEEWREPVDYEEIAWKEVTLPKFKEADE